MASAITSPPITQPQGRSPPNTPRTTVTMRSAWGAGDALGWAVSDTPMP
ncbi:hypothetical protein SAOR_15805 [Salinisphaera orenii MK-B5]|uniref:Uncharacterized protein n=1 Tax=Salinisphaera orenii MK-B5 TaxID=856730 RepID=A0A423PFM5_9GAMM|nr:hypothetical protein SAOR_15805 [Salinisphaera orenii MK-B5]